MSKNSSKISNKNKQGMFSRSKFAQKWILEWESMGSESTLPRYHVCQFSGKIDNFDFFGTNLAKNKFWGRNFENLSPDSQSAPLRYHVCQFSGKTDSFEFSWPKLWKFSN